MALYSLPARSAPRRPAVATTTLLLLLLFALGCQRWLCVHGFYIAASAPHHYRVGESLPVYWNKIYPGRKLLGPSLSYARLPFVCPTDGNDMPNANLGQRLAGDQLVRSDIQLSMDRNITCQVLCRREVDGDAVEQAVHLVRQHYMVEWFADELPGTHPWSNIMDKQKRYGDGFPLGYYDPLEDKVFIYNHFIIQLLYEKPERDPNQRLIVGFEIYPKSVESVGRTCPHDASVPGMPQQALLPSTQAITYTYSVLWIEDKQMKWGERWRNYLNYENDKSIPVFSLVNAAIILLVLTIIIGVIVLRVLEVNFPLIANKDNSEQDELHGWKQLHGDVFRPPEQADLLAVLVGSGLQLLASVLGVLVLGVLGIVNPSYPGGLITWAIIIYMLGGAMSGYMSARLNKTLVGTDWKKHAVRTAILVPGSLYLLTVLLNFFGWVEHASNTLSFGGLVGLLALLLCIAGPITMAGAYIGDHCAALRHPVRVNAVRRAIPPAVWFMQLVPGVLFAGIPSFGAIFLEEHLIFHYLWSDRFYYFYGYTLVSFVLLIIISSFVSVSMTYFQLCNEDHRWWWRSFLFGGSVSIYIFGYAILYFLLRLQSEGIISTLLYLMHTLAASVLIGMLLGSVSFLCTYYFVRRIFKVVKVN
ncbi:hypothetical protein SYNPS1DRAFT_22517 [Syncephalis pseudoplumigaleata]|uniref:Transmembrane 9 superfamily member n=1 Tax=Syncephalis pseudoplumigaleata TaxID=1712513 RepID=A0A4P9YZF3_9FUNG|nr:hypothetical protein SYNPS1DRAFT_22517 [Syncephalis pseudoplumigaleata]|eukprot:RKP25537.1 hypothetical protein SYNPS1DRAFT_22517 [Syncephalis pseudoplumigaleata]